MSKYNHLGPSIHKLLTHFNSATNAFTKECPELDHNEMFVVLYEAAAATMGQVLGSAFATTPQMSQADMYNQALNSIKVHAEAYHRHFLQTIEKNRATSVAPSAPATPGAE